MQCPVMSRAVFPRWTNQRGFPALVSPAPDRFLDGVGFALEFTIEIEHRIRTNNHTWGGIFASRVDRCEMPRRNSRGFRVGEGADLIFRGFVAHSAQNGVLVDLGRFDGRLDASRAEDG